MFMGDEEDEEEKKHQEPSTRDLNLVAQNFRSLTPVIELGRPIRLDDRYPLAAGH